MKLDSIFSSHMVFAANKPIRIYGTGTGNIKVIFAGKENETIASGDRWEVQFEPMNYGGPYELYVTCGDETIVFDDIFVGEVYLCAGQSNIELKMKDTNTPDELYKSNNMLRYFSVDKLTTNGLFAARDGWVLCEKETVGEWSAIGYLSGSEICEDKKIAVGMINCNQGASVIESWVPEGTFENIGINIPLDKKDEGHELYRWNKDGALYNAQLKQVIPFSLSGVIWYQGESDTFPDEGKVYLDELCELIKVWRKAFCDAKLPFVVVQIADYLPRLEETPPLENGWKLVQAAQEEVSKVMPFVKTVISKDVCETDYIHPPTKTKLAQRIKEALL